MRIRRLFVWAARVALGLLLLVALVLSGFRTRVFFRETEERLDPSRTGAFVSTPWGKVRYQERGGPGGAPIVFVGGTMATSDTFVPLMDALCDERLRGAAEEPRSSRTTRW